MSSGKRRNNNNDSFSVDDFKYEGDDKDIGESMMASHNISSDNQISSNSKNN